MATLESRTNAQQTSGNIINRDKKNMSMEVIKKSREEEQPTTPTATQGAKGTPSLAVLGVTSGQLEALLQVSEREHQGLGSEDTAEAHTEAEPSSSGTQLAQSSGDGKIQFTQKRHFLLKIWHRLIPCYHTQIARYKFHFIKIQLIKNN